MKSLILTLPPKVSKGDIYTVTSERYRERISALKGYLYNLRRTHIGSYDVQDAFSMDDILDILDQQLNNNERSS